MAIVTVNLKVSPHAYEMLTGIKIQMTEKAGRNITYSEVIERLAELFATTGARP